MTASRGIRLVEVYANDTLVDYSAASGTSTSGTARVPVSGITSGVRTYLYVVVTDIDGEQTGSDARTVELPEQSHALPPATTVELTRPTDMTAVVDALQAAGLTPLEYIAEQIPAPAPQVDPELAQQLQADGVTPYVPADQELHYQPGQTPLTDQVADVVSYYANHEVSGSPLISTVILRSRLDQAGLGSFGQLGRVEGSVGGRPTAVAPPAATDAEMATRAAKLARARAAEVPAKSGRTAPAAASRALEAAAAAQVGYWPKFGRMNVDTYSRTRNRLGLDCGLSFFGPPCRPVIEQVSEPKAEIQHQIVWTRESLQLFGVNSDAYEHNLVVQSPGRGGIRPVCNPFSEDDFYVRAETAKVTVDNVPADAELYNDDVTVADPCSKNEVSFGIVYPEKLADGVPAGQLPAIVVRQESARNDSADRDLFLAAQSLDRDDRGCSIAPAFLKKYCIGESVDETLQATLARTGGQIGATGLPACVVCSGWAFPPEASVPSSQVSQICGADRDHDGYDDQIDCAPDDPAINPGAVDVPNDGIDQNCDGHDLTVGSGEIQVTLLWDNDNDQDLHVTEPGGTEIWYQAPGPTGTGGRLDRDDNVGVCGRDTEPGGVENIFWPTGATPARGIYQVNVVQYASCGTLAAWTAEVRIGNVLVNRKSGTGTGSFSFEY